MFKQFTGASTLVFKMRVWLIGTLILMAGTVGAHAQDVIKFGIIGPMAFIQGEHHWNGATLAAEEINKAGGIKVGGKAYKVELVKADSNENLSVPDASNAMERILSRDKVNFVIGGFRSEAVLAMQEIAMDYKTIFIGTGATHDSLGQHVKDNYDRYKYWFLLTPMKASDLGKSLFAMFGAVGGQIGKELGVAKPKVAVVAEKVIWTEALVKAAQGAIPKMGMELVGLWQPSPNATDVTAELSAIKSSGAQIVLTILSGSVGVTLGRQMAEMELPAVAFGINVEAQGDSFMEATAGKGNYVSTLNTFAAGVENTPKTVAFVDTYKKRFGKTPAYTAATHDALLLVKEVIEKENTLDSDKLVAALEKVDTTTAASRLKFDEFHTVIFGPGFATGLGVQWQDGKQVAFWPNNWNGVTYKGVVPFKIPPSLKK